MRPVGLGLQKFRRSIHPLLEKSHPMFNQIFALAMAAQARGSLINFQYNGCGGAAGNSYPLIGQVIAN
jgi:hypothetical protein